MVRKNAYADEASRELREIVRHASALLDATAGEADDRIKKARTQLEERLSAAKDKYRELDSAVDGLIDDTVAAADQVVRERPYHVIGGTFLAGLLLGWLMSRK